MARGADILVTNAGGPPPGHWSDWDRTDFLKALDGNMLTDAAALLSSLAASPNPAGAAIADVLARAQAEGMSVAEALAPPAPEAVEEVVEPETAVEVEPVETEAAEAEAKSEIETAAEEPVAEAETTVTEETTPVVEEPVVTEQAEATPEEQPAAAVEETPTVEAEVVEEAPAAIGEATLEDLAAAAEEAEVVIVAEEEPQSAAAAAAASDDALTLDAPADGTAEVELEELTEANTRSSTEDFATAATGSEATTSSSDSGLSPFQRALLLGLGAVVVGQVLSNGDEVVSNSGDRVVVARDGDLVVLKDDDALLRQPGSQIETQRFDDGSSRTIVTRENGERIVTIRSSDGRVLRRARVLPDGTQIVLFDDTQPQAVEETFVLPAKTAPAETALMSDSDVLALREALLAREAAEFERAFTLRQIREIRQVRELAPEVELDTVTFASGSAAIDADQARELAKIGFAIADIIADDPRQVFLIEGHTDAVGSASYNLALSDRRAETVALALTEYFDIPPENLITQGYGESYLKVLTLESERANRRASVRNISVLLR